MTPEPNEQKMDAIVDKAVEKIIGQLEPVIDQAVEQAVEQLEPVIEQAVDEAVEKAVDHVVEEKRNTPDTAS